MQLLTLAIWASAILAAAHAAPNPLKLDVTISVNDESLDLSQIRNKDGFFTNEEYCWSACWEEEKDCFGPFYSKQIDDCWTCCIDPTKLVPDPPADDPPKDPPVGGAQQEM